MNILLQDTCSHNQTVEKANEDLFENAMINCIEFDKNGMKVADNHSFLQVITFKIAFPATLIAIPIDTVHLQE